MPANSILNGPITGLLILCIFIETLSRVHAKGGGGNWHFIGIGRFPSHGAASMALKGLILCLQVLLHLKYDFVRFLFVCSYCFRFLFAMTLLFSIVCFVSVLCSLFFG